MTLKMYTPPGNLPDFDHIPGQLQQWSNAISGWVDGSIASEYQKFDEAGHPDAKVQFFNALRDAPAGLSLNQGIVWNAFPRTLVLGYGGKLPAYHESEKLIPLTAPRPGLPTAPPFYTDAPGGPPRWADLYYRPLDEYCEWRTERDPSGKVVRITFTSEPPEYWQALHGDTLQDANGQPAYEFTGDKKLLLDLYRQYVSPAVQLADLTCQYDYVQDGSVVYPKGSYNPYNRWNAQDGIMHLSHPNNFIAAEIQLAADATILRHKNGKPVVQADALVCGAGYGGTSRSSDPSIGASVNDLARLGAWITLQDPIGLYMHDLNTEGFTKPNGEPIDPKEYFRVLRGNEALGMIERAVFEVPATEGFSVGDLKIGGVPIQWGGQVAEHLNIIITGTAVAPGAVSNPLLDCPTFSCINITEPRALTRVLSNGDAIPPGYRQVFLDEQGTFGPAPVQPQSLLLSARALPGPGASYRERRPTLPHKHR